MQVFVSLGDKDSEAWLRKALGTQYTEDLERATHALVSRLADAKRALAFGHAVRLVVDGTEEAGERLAKAAASLGISDVFRTNENTRAADLLAFLLGAEAPKVRAAHQPATLWITSAPGSGGTFVAWNLYAALVRSGKQGALVALAENSPLKQWVQGGVEGMASDLQSAPSDVDFWIVDASGIDAGSGEADVRWHVVDGDWSKWGDLSGRTVVCNRWPENTESLEGTRLVLPDFGKEQFAAMRSGVAVSVTAEGTDFAQALLSVYAEEFATDEPPLSVAEGFIEKTEETAEEAEEDVSPAKSQAADGFDLEG